MKTTFGLWLMRRGETPFAFARRVGVRYNRVRILAGMASVPSERQLIDRFDARQLLMASAETGISTDTLLAEALAAADEPTPARPYRRQQKPGGRNDVAV